MRLFHLVADVAGKQAGVISRPQLIELGFSSTAIQRSLQQRTFVRIHRGIFRVASAADGRDARLWAALLWAGEGAVLSHLAAAWHWKLDGLGFKPPDEIDVTVPARRVVVATRNVRIHRTRILEPVKDFAALRRFPCTSLARTIVDLAGMLPADDLECAFSAALRLNRENRHAIQLALMRLAAGGRAGLGALAEIVALPDLGVTGSRLEDLVAIAIRRAGIRAPLPQLQICDRFGNQIGIFDFAWPERRVVICCDSWSWHFGNDIFERDRKQWTQLSAAGWHPVFATWRRITREQDEFIAELREALELELPISV